MLLVKALQQMNLTLTLKLLTSHGIDIPMLVKLTCSSLTLGLRLYLGVRESVSCKRKAARGSKNMFPVCLPGGGKAEGKDDICGAAKKTHFILTFSLTIRSHSIEQS